ncbi:MAG TPA: FtsX-like permease family protein [Phytomonospora sp.]
MLRLALAGLRARPASFFGLAAAMFLAVAAITLFGSLTAAAIASDGDSGLGVIAGAFGEVAMIMAVFAGVGTLGFAVRQQYREMALLRTIAATPRQIRRLVRVQALGVVAAVSPPAWLAGSLGARFFLAELAARGLAPTGAEIPGTPLPMLIATTVTALVGGIATAFAAWRVSRRTPVAVLTDADSATDRLHWLRAVTGSLILLGVGVLCTVIVRREPDDAAQGALLGALAMMAAVGLLGPVPARAVVTLLGAPLRGRRCPGGRLATANLRGHAHRLSSAVVPIALLVGLSTTFLAITGTIRHAAPPGTLHDAASDTDVWLRGVELAMLACFGAVATLNTLISLTLARRREYALLALLGATRAQLVRMLAVEAVLTAATGAVLGIAVAAPVGAAFALALTGSPIPWLAMGTYGPILAAAVLLAVGTMLLAGLRAVSRDPATAMAAP